MHRCGVLRLRSLVATALAPPWMDVRRVSSTAESAPPPTMTTDTCTPSPAARTAGAPCNPLPAATGHRNPNHNPLDAHERSLDEALLDAYSSRGATVSHHALCEQRGPN